MRVISTIQELTTAHGCMFVPTMGALHEGHFALVREAARARDAASSRRSVVVSIFVNPTQFNDPKDLARYPRTLDADAAGCACAGADLIFAPEPEVIYPFNHAIPVPALPAVATQPGLEDARRPGHFAGVCQVVKRLFDLVCPTAAFFGEKDWQQLQVIRAMVEHERMPVRIIPVPTVRESDGLAMSSRNVFLGPEDRARAAAISRALQAACTIDSLAAAESVMRRTLEGAGLAVEYAVVRDAASLAPLTSESRGLVPSRALIAVRCGPVRLIDNSAWSDPRAGNKPS